MTAKRLIALVLLLPALGAGASEWTVTARVDRAALRLTETAAGLRPDFPGAVRDALPGEPDLPARLVRVPLPAGVRLAGFDVVLGPAVTVGPDAVAPAPAIRDEDGRLRTPAPGLRARGAASVRLLGQPAQGGRREALFLWRPLVREGGALRLSEDLTLHLRGEADPAPPLRPLREAAADGGPWTPRERPSLEGGPVDAVVVTTEAMASAFQGLADWHTARGTRTAVRTVEWIADRYPPGRDRGENIRFFLQEAYQLWGLQAVILGGDTETIPARYVLTRATSEEGDLLPTDLYYACLDGTWNADGDEHWGEAFYDGITASDETDLLPELMVGRLPAHTAAEAGDLVTKLTSLYRETALTGFQHRILFLAEVLHPADWTPGEDIIMDGADFTVSTIRNRLDADMEHAALFENWQNQDGEDWTGIDPQPLGVVAAVDSMDTGRFAFVDQDGHGYRYTMSVGDGGIVASHVAALTNAAPFHINLMNCSSAAYDYDCLAERFLLHPTGGAIAAFGTTDSSYPIHSIPYADDYYARLFQDDITRPGAAQKLMREARAYLAEEEGYGRWTYFLITFLGDPLLDLWAGAPRQLDVAAPASLAVGDHTVDVTVTAGGQPVAGARATLQKAGEVWATGATDAAGLCQLPARPLTPGSLDLVVWAANADQVAQAITVTGAVGPFVHVATLAVDDDPAHGPTNNGDGRLDGGETAFLVATLRNAGDAAADGVALQLLSLNDSLAVSGGPEVVGSLAAGAASDGATGVHAALPALGAADGGHVRVEAVLTGGNIATRRDTLLLTLHAPRPVIAEWELDDGPDGDGDGNIEPGELLRAKPRWLNLGGGATGTLTATLASLDAGLTVTPGEDQVTVPSLGLMDGAQPDPGFQVSLASIVQEYLAVLTVNDGFGRVSVDTFDFRRPYPPTDLATDTSDAADAIALRWTASTAGDVAGYHVYVAQGEAPASTGDYARATLLPVAHTAVYLEGLLENSATHLFATAVDSGGMESVPSAILHTSTNPAQLAGFPQELLATCSSSPAVANVAGDGGLELVAAADAVYVWHHDGTEVRDGDGEATTNGVFSLDAYDIVGAVSLLPLLDDGYRQIVVATRGAPYAIHAFDHAGQYLPGWPRTTTNWIWTNLVGADLDGDGDVEVVGLDHAGKVYAFHHDGSEVVDGDSNPGTIGVLRAGLGTWTLGSPAAGDLDGDGADEFVVATTNGFLYALNGAGGDLAGFPVDLDLGGAGWYDVKTPLVLCNLDGDAGGTLEILVQTEADSLFAFRADGSRFPGFPRHFVTNNAATGPGPAPVDIDGDGDLELLVVESIAGEQSILHLIDHDGGDRAGWPVALAANAESSPVVGDLDGDGDFEFVWGNEQGILYGLREDGSVQPGFPISVGGEIRGTPTLADLDHDGDSELVAATWNRRVLVWDLPGAFGAASCPWPTLSGGFFRRGNASEWDDVPVALSNIRLAWEDGAVCVAWTGAGAPRWGLWRERRLALGWGEGRLLGEDLAAADDQFTWRDSDVAPGGRYRYFALAWLGDDWDRLALGEVTVPETPWRDRFAGAFPNPFNPATTLRFETAQAGPVTLDILAPSGRRLRRLCAGDLPAGRHELAWDGRDDAGRRLASGVYFARLSLPGHAEARRLVLLK
ncbi:MAG: hypothetical protein JW819_07460 [Candidatus Krumholzibacteriota bacterium]|nr:hypothetical protein [Candidatus Krumholzibacteriota bacterium]